MGGKLWACSECSRACLTIHKSKRDANPIVFSFFKIMFGNRFSEALIVPPKFAKTIMELDGKSTYLEDSTGQKWEVSLSDINGSLAFQKGWHEFVVDHDIQMGDLLVFNYFKGSHFNVQIFGRSGCEKPMIFGGKDYQNKRAKVTKDLVSRDDPCNFPINNSLENECFDFLDTRPSDGVDVDVVQRKEDGVNVIKSPAIEVHVTMQENAKKRPKVDPTTDIPMESCFMNNRNASADDDRDNSLFDLSIFEMPTNEVDVRDESIHGRNRSSESSVLKTTQIQVAKGERKRIVKQEPISDANVAISGDFSWDRTAQPTTKRHKLEHGCFDRKFNSTVEEDKGQRDMAVNLEALTFRDPPTSDFKITCLVNHNSRISLELPKALPVQVCAKGETPEQKLVFLLDPAGRLWPVKYHQKQGLHVLDCGWEEFRKFNSIQLGDQCTFVVKNIDESIIHVQICRRCKK